MIDVDAIKTRILSMMEQLGMTPSAFADQAGISRSALTHLASGRNKVTLDMINKIVQGFDEWNPEWIIFGHGPQKQGVTDSSDMFGGDLFSSAASVGAIMTTEAHRESVSQHYLAPKGEPEVRIIEKPEKQIERITVFYSDGSYQEFRRVTTSK